MDVFVITDTEAGWDSVRGVYSTYAKAKQACAYFDEVPVDKWDSNESVLIIHEESLDLSDA